MFTKHLKQLKNVRCLATAAARPQKSPPFNKILISNRGEIACRIIRTARRLGVHTVSVYSDHDEDSMHVQLADEAYRLGKSPATSSYLCGERIVEIAKRAGAHAIHPGYGFLSESVEFADLCGSSGVTLIGPPTSAIRDMGVKNTSKSIMAAAGVPIIEGYHGEDQSNERLIAEANKIGYPIMIKAVRGGGGKGMRIAERPEDFNSALTSARTESAKAFNNSAVLLERFVRSPRHVEVQIFADQHGNAVYLWERDCSVQRRHQKIIEEAPAPGLSDELRHELGEAAVRAAKAVGYVGAGTVEFILDKQQLSFHFMEMNTRLQVEHPITEMITGTDLVEWQLRVAAGEKLPLTQAQITRKGHAFEARIYAENPRDNFLPGAGPVQYLSLPQTGEHVRLETAVRQGDEVSVHYDPMIGKLIAWGANRSLALQTLRFSLREFHIAGVETNINFLLDLAAHPSFQQGDVHTGFIEEHYESLFPQQEDVAGKEVLCAALVIICAEQAAERCNSIHSADPFTQAPNARLNHELIQHYKLKANDKLFNVAAKFGDMEHMEIKIKNGLWQHVKAAIIPSKQSFRIRANIDDQISAFDAHLEANELTLFTEAGKTLFEIVQPSFVSAQLDAQPMLAGAHVVSPMPGVLEKLLVQPGDHVKKGDRVAVLIAMKMEHVLKAPKDAVVKSTPHKTGSNVPKGAAIVVFEEEPQ